MSKQRIVTIIGFAVLFLASATIVYACSRIVEDRREMVQEYKAKLDKRFKRPSSYPVYVPPTEDPVREPVEVPTEPPVMPPSQGKNG